MTTGIQKKPISDFLQQLINDANEAIEQSQITIKEKLLYVYNQAKEEGYTPQEARKLMENEIPMVSDRYIREVLPEEAKNLNMRRLPNSGTVPQISQESHAEVVNIPQTTPNIVDVETTKPDYEKESIGTLNDLEKGEIEAEEFLKKDSELKDTLQLLKEERSKTKELNERLELREREHEAEVEALKDKVTELDRLTDQLTAQLQEQSRKLTMITMQVDNAIPEPPTEQNYSIDTDIKYNGKKIPIVVRCFISGKKIGWIDKELYKARYGREPEDE